MVRSTQLRHISWLTFFLEIYFLSVATESRFRFINKSTNEKKAIFGWPNASRFFFNSRLLLLVFFSCAQKEIKDFWEVGCIPVSTYLWYLFRFGKESCFLTLVFQHPLCICCSFSIMSIYNLGFNFFFLSGRLFFVQSFFFGKRISLIS